MTGALSAGGTKSLNLAAGDVFTVVASADGEGTVRGTHVPYGADVGAGETVKVGPFTASRQLSIVCTAGSLSWSVAPADLADLDTTTGTVAITETYSGDGSYQPVWADLELTAAAGSDVPDTAFLSPVMGNVMGADLTKDGTYLGGLIGAVSITGAKGSLFQAGGVLGVVMDGVTDVDGAVVAVIDGSDPSSETRATAAFAARMNNNNAASGVDYGLDLHDAGRGAAMTAGLPLAIANAAVRMDNEVCVKTGDGAPVDGTEGTGVGFAGPGSIYVDFTNANAYINAGTKASPTWKLITRAA